MTDEFRIATGGKEVLPPLFFFLSCFGSSRRQEGQSFTETPPLLAGLKGQKNPSTIRLWNFLFIVLQVEVEFQRHFSFLNVNAICRQGPNYVLFPSAAIESFRNVVEDGFLVIIKKVLVPVEKVPRSHVTNDGTRQGVAAEAKLVGPGKTCSEDIGATRIRILQGEGREKFNCCQTQRE